VKLLPKRRRKPPAADTAARTPTRRLARMVALINARDATPAHPTLRYLHDTCHTSGPHRAQHGSGIRSSHQTKAKRRRLRRHHARLRNVAIRSAGNTWRL
jgi:hypothetical protein